MKQLFEGNQETSSKIKINKNFAERYEKKKQRELLDKNKDVISEESDSSIEDEDGELINDRVTGKFIETLAKLRYKHPDIYKQEPVFDENDFDEPVIQKKVKKVTAKDMIGVEEEYRPTKDTPEEEQLSIKQAFLQAAKATATQKELLKIKKKNLKEIEDENKEFEKILQKNKKRHNQDDMQILEQFWGNEENLDEKERFLRKYILTKGWIDREDLSDKIQSSEEDEERMDQFEEKYNFRFEEPNANQIVTYERDQPETMRQDGEKARKRQREAKALRRKEQKQQLERDLQQLKLAKKNELIAKLQKIQEVGDVRDTKELLGQIQEEFDPDQYDKKMNQVFGEDYFDEDDQQEEELYSDREDDSKPDEQQQDINNVIQIKPTIPIGLKKNPNQEEIDQLQGEDVNIWWFCDYCQEGIQPGAFRWDCLICDDYTVCEKCNDKHKQHKLKKAQVPNKCVPPKAEELEEILQQFKYCRSCAVKLTNENDVYQGKKDFLCPDCWEKDIKKDRYTLVPAEQFDVEDMLENNPEALKERLPEQVKNLVDEYYNIDFEDVIAGGIKTKFQYIEVEKDGFGLTNDDLLYADDALLNKYLSIKKLAPYRKGEIRVSKKQQALLATIKASAKKNKKEILRNREPIVEEKPKRERIHLEVEDPVENNTLNVQSKRLKSYGV